MIHDVLDRRARPAVDPSSGLVLDVDEVQLHHGSSGSMLVRLESLDLCARTCGSDVLGGTRISRDGESPLTTHGGQLSKGRLHGVGHVYEAVPSHSRGTRGMK